MNKRLNAFVDGCKWMSERKAMTDRERMSRAKGSMKENNNRNLK